MLAVRYETAFDLYPYEKVASQDAAPVRHPVVIVGGGPVGLSLALDLGKKGTPALLLDDHEGAGLGSKAICFAKRTLDIAHRLGASDQMVKKGVVWNVGRVFHGDGKLFSFDLQPEAGHRNPAFINLQQPYFEKFLVDAIRQAQSNGAPIEIRGRNCVAGLTNHDDYVSLEVETPDGPYVIEADYLVACDGARSPIREMMGLTFDGRVFEDNFLIADVRMKAEFPTERWFWFEPPFKNSGQSALLHKQPDDVWRIDFQLGWDIDREKELDKSRIRARVDAMLSSQTGAVPDYDLVWTSIYTFQCRRMKRFRHGPVFFAGDSAHQVSPFGARGANSGVQDGDNLGWKLDLVLKGRAPKSLLESYASEREFGAELVNSGRLSRPCTYDGFEFFGEDALNGPQESRPGAACPDAPIEDGFLLDHLGDVFTVLVLGDTPISAIESDEIEIKTVPIKTPSKELRARYLGEQDKGVYLIRPDQHVVARWASFDAASIESAISTALGKR